MFIKRLPESRLGKKHESLDDYQRAIHPFQAIKSKEYTLVIVTETQIQEENNENDIVESANSNKLTTARPKPKQQHQEQSLRRRKRILLGLKNRGFGKGMYNSFGGKFLHDLETVEECACRELYEETHIHVSIDEMKHSKVGIQRYTFDNNPEQMIMHVFYITLNPKERTYEVIGCDEITPEWYDDIYTIPLDNMFADDSLWLTSLLSYTIPIEINGWYHFQENCQETNTILHHYMDIRPKQQLQSNFTLEQRLFHALHNKINNPTIKEFKECYAFCNAVRAGYAKKRTLSQQKIFDIVIDVAGGHGALAAMLLICTSAYRAVVVDPADVGGGSVEKAWGDKFIAKNKTLLYRHECLRTGLPDELEKALKESSADRILVVACHACQHLSEEVLHISCQYGVHVAVMPCCQKDQSPGSTWKATSKNLSIPVAHVIDLLQCGKVMALGSYDVRMKLIDSKITPQNRIILCRALSEEEMCERDRIIDKAHSKLNMTYQKAHGVKSRQLKTTLYSTNLVQWVPSSPLWSLLFGFVAGAVTVTTFQRKC